MLTNVQSNQETRRTFGSTATKAAESRSNPGDVPAGRPAELDYFEALTGTWDLEASFEAGRFGADSAAITAKGVRTTFDWLEGQFFLIQRFVSNHPAAPGGIAIIGAGNIPGTFEQHYYDSRGVARVYRTTCDGRTWRVWREESGFWQRYVGAISEDGCKIVGAWEGSSDGREWTRDFGLTYTRSMDGAQR